MWRTTIYLLGLLALSAGCTKSADKATPTPSPSPAAGGAMPTPTVGGAGASCDAAVRHAYDVVRATGSESLKAASAGPPDETIAACQSQGWSQEIRDCLMATTAARDVYYNCYAQGLKGHKILVARRIDALADNSALDPPPLSQDGDFYGYMAEGKECGALKAISPPAHAIFLLCEGQLMGPFMVDDDVKKAFEALSADEKYRHDMVMGMLKYLPSGRFGGNTRVYDQNGTYLYTE